MQCFSQWICCNEHICRVVKKVLCTVGGDYMKEERSEFLLVALSLLACWPKYNHFACYIESFPLPSLSPSPVVVVLVSIRLVSIPLIVSVQYCSADDQWWLLAGLPWIPPALMITSHTTNLEAPTPKLIY